MSDLIQISAFEAGKLRKLDAHLKARETVLALSLNRLLVRLVRVPNDRRDSAIDFITPILKAMSPFPDEPLTVSYEVVTEDARGQVVLAAALPESAADDIAEALDAAKLNVVRIDSLAIGMLRGLWSQLHGEDGARRLVLMAGEDCLSLVLVDGTTPVAVRALTAGGDLKRDVMLALLEAEDFGGAKPLAEIVTVGAVDAGSLLDMAPIRKLEVGEDAALVGVSQRSNEEGVLNALPESWREVLEESRFKRKLCVRLGIAGGIWALVMAILFGVPFAFGMMTQHMKTLSREHRRKYEEVVEMKHKVEVIRQYSDHTLGALEIMKAVSDRLPGDVTLNNYRFKRNDTVAFSGEADSAGSVYTLKDNLDALRDEGVFQTVELRGPSATRNNKQKFDIECGFVAPEDRQ